MNRIDPFTSSVRLVTVTQAVAYRDVWRCPDCESRRRHALPLRWREVPSQPGQRVEPGVASSGLVRGRHRRPVRRGLRLLAEPSPVVEVRLAAMPTS